MKALLSGAARKNHLSIILQINICKSIIWVDENRSINNFNEKD